VRPTFKRLSAPIAIVAALTLALACTNGGTGGGGGGDGGQNGPDPNALNLNAGRGPMAISSRLVGGDAGFNSGTVTYPTQPGKYGAIVVVPGFISVKQQVGWYAPVLASRGFVVLTIDTNTVVDLPAARSNQQNRALEWLAKESPVADRVDPSRLGVMGWSMGGGGTLEAARKNNDIKAAVSLAAWDITTFIGMDTPTLVVACNGDIVAPPAAMSRPFYASINAEKAYLGVPNVLNHFCVTAPSDLIATYVIAWFKRWLDGDERYSKIICNRPANPAATYQSTCPM
jgi:hypothetical protein